MSKYFLIILAVVALTVIVSLLLPPVRTQAPDGTVRYRQHWLTSVLHVAASACVVAFGWQFVRIASSFGGAASLPAGSWLQRGIWLTIGLFLLVGILQTIYLMLRGAFYYVEYAPACVRSRTWRGRTVEIGYGDVAELTRTYRYDSDTGQTWTGWRVRAHDGRQIKIDRQFPIEQLQQRLAGAHRPLGTPLVGSSGRVNSLGA